MKKQGILELLSKVGENEELMLKSTFIVESGSSEGDYITSKTGETFRIETLKGLRGAKVTTNIAGGRTIDNLSGYRLATREEIINFLEFELKAYKSSY